MVGLWGFATSLTVPPALDLLNFRTTAENVTQPAEELITELQRERRLSLVFLGGRAALPALDDQRTRTDKAAADFRRTAGTEETREAANDLGRRRIAEAIKALELLPSGRTFIDRRQVDRTGALGLYNGIIDTAFRMFPPLTDVSDAGLARDSRTLTALARARELLAQEDALVSGAIVNGQFAEGEPGQVIQLIGMQRYLYADAIAELPEAERVAYQKLTERDAFTELRAMEDRLMTGARIGEPVPVDPQAWQRAYETVSELVRDFEVEQGQVVADRAEPVAVGIVVRLALAGILGLIAVVAAILISLRIGRSLITRLTALRRAALDMAGFRLPDIVTRLRRGEQIDVEAEAPPLEYGSDEIGQVGRAFTEVQLTAVRSAVDEAELRRGLNEVFLNIARRSQTLLHRQLALLDKMERRTSEPEELEDLFRVDHLATRMRRHAEDLVILAGAAPGRGWRNPVPVVDVVRGAVSEVEDYARVDILLVEDASIVGRAVGDVIHLLAELIENGTSYSPPNTRVRLAGQVVPHGYAVEIEDRGLGMTPEAIAEVNERLATPPDFDPANSARLGLFVVAQLAGRHGIRVQLRPSPYGGVTAVVLIPRDLIVAGPVELPAGPSAPTDDGWAGRVRPAPVLVPGLQDAPHEATPIPLGRRHRTGSRLGAVPRPALVPAPPRESVEPVPPALVPAESVEPAEPAPATAAAPAAEPVLVTAGEPTGPAQPRQPVLLSEDGLPKRIRQASLAPQLRQQSAPPPQPATQEPAGRSPEQVRAMMNALQSGSRRGRREGTETVTANALEVPLARPMSAPLPDGPRTGPLGPAGQRTPGSDGSWFPAAAKRTPEEDA
jgi:signal transduction histidine kinase